MEKLAHCAVILFVLEMVASAPVITILSPHDGHVYTDSNNIAVELEVDRTSYHGTLPDLVLRVNGTILQIFPPKQAAIHEHSVVISDLPDGRWNLSVGYEEPPLASTVVGFSVSIIIRNVRVHEWPDMSDKPCITRGECADEAFTGQDLEALKQCTAQNFEPRSKPAKIFDAFTFNDEIELLEVRLFELAAVVHKFIIIEANLTHQLRPKPLHLDTHLHRIAPYMHQIIRVTVDTELFKQGGGGGGWGLEAAQRNAMLEALDEHAEEQDLV
eukprot:781480-Rhodomonas_salina.2